LNEEAKALLQSLDSWQRSKWVFPSRNPAQPIDPDNFMRVYREAVIASKIEWVTWHDLRYTFASRLAMRGVPLTTMAVLLRHSTTSLVKRYAHLSPAYLKAAVEEVSAFGKAEPVAVAQVLIAPSSDETVTKTGIGDRAEGGSCV